MAFGQSSGPPATNKDLTRLAELLEAAGYQSFKEARHPLGLNQRQAAGRFTRDEAAELIERLEGEAELASLLDDDGGRDGGETAEAEGPSTGRRASPKAGTTRAGGAASGTSGARAGRVARVPKPADKLSLAATPDAVLVTELELRGWTCIPPVTLDDAT
jgi:hypothetical protein